MVVVVGVELSRLRTTAIITSLFCTRQMADGAWFVCINRRHQAVESPSHVHRFFLLTKIVVECMFLWGG